MINQKVTYNYFGCYRLVYNQLFSYRSTYYGTHGVGLTSVEISPWIQHTLLKEPKYFPLNLNIQNLLLLYLKRNLIHIFR